MSEFNHDESWLNNFHSCEAVGREIMEKISQRNSQQRNSIAHTQASAKARQLMKTFNDNRNMLTKKLQCSKELLTSGEYERRERLLDSLTTKKLQIDTAFNDSSDGSNRVSLLGSNQPLAANIWGVEEETDETRDLTYEELQEHKQFAIQEQDRGLEQLHSVVVRQKLMAQNIGEELDLHNEIIDDITDHADRTRERLIKETRHVTIVDRKSNTCGYWIAILLLMITIIVIVSIPKRS